MEVVKKVVAEDKKKTIGCIGCKKTSKTTHINIRHEGDDVGLCDNCVRIFRGEP